MKCEKVLRGVSAYLDGSLPVQERQDIAAHLEGCDGCALHLEQHREIRSAMRALPRPVPPEHLGVALSVAASRERARRQARASLSKLVNAWLERFCMEVNDLMRPLAIPFAGGLVSAVVLFSMLVPKLSPSSAVSHDNDVPTMLTTEAALKSTLSFGLSDNDIVVDVLVDEQGRMVDYSIPHGQRWVKDAQTRRSVENTLLCTQFTPATVFGAPAPGKLRITLRRSQVDVKG